MNSAGRTLFGSVNPSDKGSEANRGRPKDAASGLGLQIEDHASRHPANWKRRSGTSPAKGGLMVSAPTRIFSRGDANRSQNFLAKCGACNLPNPDSGVAGGLIRYGGMCTENYLKGGYVGRILKGEPPETSRYIQSSWFELVVESKARARAIGIAVPLPLSLALMR